MSYGKVKICGINTSGLKTLPEKEKIRLLKLAQSGDKKAREELINGNLRLILSVIQRFSGRGETFDDLFQVGCIGLIKSIDNFDISQNVRFSTYAVPMIIGEIRRHLRDNNSIRVSRSMRDTAYRAMQIKEQMLTSKNKEPSIEEIAQEMGVSKETVVLSLESVVEPVSLNEPVFSDGEGDTVYIMDQIGNNDGDSNWLDEIFIKQAVKKLSMREKNILSLRFLKGKTQTEVAKKIGISQAQVSRLEKTAMKKIKEKEVAEMAEEKPETKGEKFTGTAEDMRAAMEKATNLKVVYITTADFDADGNNESFALATDDSKDPYWGYHTAEIWFVDSNGECQCIKKEENISMNDEVLGGGNLFFNYEKHEYQTSSVSCLYGVKNGQPYELQISGKYMNFRIDENRNKYIAEDPEYNEGQQYEDIFFEYDENIEEFYKITN